MKKELLTYSIDDKRYYNSILLVEKCNEGINIKYYLDDVVIEIVDNRPFDCLVKLRRALLKRNLLLMCEGSRIDVYPSGASFSTLIAYKVTMGKVAEVKDKVNIFDPTSDLDMIGSDVEQKDYRERWINSLE